LITGGYLVLDPQFQGTVVALDARFHTKVEPLLISNQALSGCRIIVDSPQFMDGKWEYEWTSDHDLK
jgi:phosphomevalonate kinase